MALTTTEEAQLRALIAQQAALLSLASSESTIISKLGATKATLSDLSAASSLSDSDLFLVRQGSTDKSATGDKVRALANVAASDTVAGVMETATEAEIAARTAGALAIIPSRAHRAPSACKAWVNFNGATGAILSGYNVSSVTREAAGTYVINFTAALSDANYAWAGAPGEASGTVNGPSFPGGNNHLAGTGPVGSTALKTTSQLRVFNWEASSPVSLEDATSISVLVFGL